MIDRVEVMLKRVPLSISGCGTKLISQLLVCNYGISCETNPSSGAFGYGESPAGVGQNPARDLDLARTDLRAPCDSGELLGASGVEDPLVEEADVE